MDAREYKQMLLNNLYAPYKRCMECPLATLGRTNVVFGQGDPDAKLMFIGEAPGRDEDEQGRPFIGRSGKLLTQCLELVGIQRDKVFITNIVKCRPPNNRKPSPIESNTCKNLLLIHQIRIIRPKLICTLGASALQGLLNKENVAITKVRGIKQKFEDTDLLPTYHPAYILRNPRELKTFIKDLELARAIAYPPST